MNGITTIPVSEQLSLDEAASLFEEWKEEHVMGPGMFRVLIFVINDGSLAAVNMFVASYDEVFLSKYTGSSGNPREFPKGMLPTLGI